MNRFGIFVFVAVIVALLLIILSLNQKPQDNPTIINIAPTEWSFVAFSLKQQILLGDTVYAKVNDGRTVMFELINDGAVK